MSIVSVTLPTPGAPADYAIWGDEVNSAITALVNAVNNLTIDQVGNSAEYIRDTIGAALVAGAGISIAVDDPNNTITVGAVGSGSGAVSGSGNYTPIISTANANDIVFSSKLNSDPYPRIVFYGNGDVRFLDGQTNPVSLTGDAANSRMTLQGNGSKILLDLLTATADSGSHPLFEVTDANQNPLTQLMNGPTGWRQYVYETVMQAVSGTVQFLRDMNGYVVQKGSAQFAHDGPPGNALDYATASAETFGPTRTGSTGTWTGTNVTLASALDPAGTTPPTNPGEDAHVLQLTQNAGTTFTASTGTAAGTMVLAAAGNYVKAIVLMKAAASVSRTITPTLTFLDSSGNPISGSIAGNATTVNSSGYVVLSAGGVAPTGTGGCRIDLAGSSMAVGDILYVGAAGIWVNNATSGSSDPNPSNVWSPPYVPQFDGSAYTSVRTGDIYRRTDVPATAGNFMLDGAADALYLPRQVGAPGSANQPRWISTQSTAVSGGGGGGSSSSSGTLPFTTRTGNYTLGLGDVGTCVEIGSSSSLSTVQQIGTAGAVIYNGGSSTTLVFTCPAGVVDGDLLIVFAGNQTAAASIAAPSGWTPIEVDTSVSALAVGGWYRVASGEVAGTTTYTFTTGASRAMGTIVAFGGNDTVNPIDVHAQHTESAASTTGTLPSVTTTGANEMLIAMACAKTVSTSTNGHSWTPPSGWTELTDQCTTSVTTANIVMEVLTKTAPTAGSTPASTVTIDTSSNIVEIVAAIKAGSSGSAASTVTIPPSSSVAWPVGAVIELWQAGGGQITVAAGSGVSIQSPSGSYASRAQYSTLSLRYRGNDNWALSGDLA